MNDDPQPPTPRQTDAEWSRSITSWVDAAPFGVLTTDAQLRIRSWNRWLASHSNRRESELIGRNLLEAIPEIGERNLAHAFTRALAGDIAIVSTALHKYLIRLPGRAGEDAGIDMLQTARVVPLYREGQVVGTIAYIEDVTQRERNALTLRRQQLFDQLHAEALALILESTNPVEAMSLLFPKLTGPLRVEAYVHFSMEPGSTEMRLQGASGIPAEAKQFIALSDAKGPGPCSRIALMQEPLFIFDVQQSDLPHAALIKSIGMRCYVGFPLKVEDRMIGTLSFGSYSRDNIEQAEIELLSEVAKYLSIAIDRSLREDALRAARREIAAHAETLETKIEERTRSLQESVMQLESFTYSVSHDLRAPIRAVRMYTNILLCDHSESLAAPGHDVVKRLNAAAGRLEDLAADLLRYSRVVREEVFLEPLSLEPVLQELAEIMPHLGGALKFAQPLGVVMAQGTLLTQCLLNLFENAFKFARAGEPLQIRVQVRTSDNGSAPSAHPSAAPFQSARTGDQTASGGRQGRVRVWVEDNGIGIPEHLRDKIWGIFERGTGVNHIEGTGIGLAIVARAMQRMQGSCGVEPGNPHGSRFWLEFLGAPN